MKAIKTLLSAAVVATTLATAVTAQAATLRMGMVTPPSHIWNKTADRFTTNLQSENSDFKIKIFPLGKLGGDDQMIDLLQTGGLQLAILTAGSLSNREASMNAWFLPYVFENVEQAAAASRKPAARQMLADLANHKLIGLGYTMAGMRHLISAKPINSAKDFQNNKIRSFPNRVFNDWWGKLGAAPTALPLADVAPALSTNLLDGVDVDLDITVGLKFYQQAPNLALTNHMAFPGVIVASQKWWETLSADEQEALKTALTEAEDWGFAEQAKAEVSNLQKLKDAGVAVTEISDAVLQDVGAEIVKSYAAENALIAKFLEENQ